MIKQTHEGKFEYDGKTIWFDLSNETHTSGPSFNKHTYRGVHLYDENGNNIDYIVIGFPYECTTIFPEMVKARYIEVLSEKADTKAMEPGGRC